MVNITLYKREIKGSVKLLVIFAAVITLYVSIIIGMYDPEQMALLDGIVETMPEIMAAVGMKAGASSLSGFMISYLYGFILLIFPMVFCILRGNGLIARYIDRGSMVALVAAPVKRRTVAFTQMTVLVSGILFLVVYSTVVQIMCSELSVPGELDVSELLRLNGGLLCLHLFIGGICFLASCIFSDTRYSIGFGTGIPALMYVLQMLSNVGGSAEKAKYFTFFTLYNPEGIIAGDGGAMIGTAVLLIGSIILYLLGIIALCRRDLHI